MSSSPDLRSALARSAAPAPAVEYVDGWGVFALPFSTGDVLALRVFPRGTFTPFVSVWHRDAAGRWSIYVDGERLDTACPRYFGPAAGHSALAAIDLTWTGPATLRVRMDAPRLDWTLTARATPAIRIANAIGRHLPAATWRPHLLVRARELMARALGIGDLALRATVPGGQRARLLPEQMFLIDESTAVLDGRDLGAPVRLAENPAIGGFHLPARGVLAVGGGTFEPVPSVNRTTDLTV